MRDGRSNDELTQRLKIYEAETLDSNIMKIHRASQAIDEITCPSLTINGITLPRFHCALGECVNCVDKYTPNAFEASCDDMIKYTLYSHYHQCTWHGDAFLEVVEVNGKPKRQCAQCNEMTEEEKEEKRPTKKSAKINSKKCRSYNRKPMREFVKKGGIYESKLKMYQLHRWHRIFLGKDVALKMFREHVINNPGTHLLTNRDHSERYQPSPDGEFQTEHFAKEMSLSMEGCVAHYRNQISGIDQITFYSHLSYEKRQDAGIVAENIRQILIDLCFERRELSLCTLRALVCIVGGCSAQYRSGSVCYELCHLALEFNIVYDRIIQAPGHGKCIADSQNGTDKTLLDMFFDCLVGHPEELEDGVKKVLTHTRDENRKLIGLAEVCFNILNDPERTKGAKSHANRANHRKIDERRYLLRPVGTASGEGVKFMCKGEGIMTCYNIRADPSLLQDGKSL
ncbi:hypothetical protein ACHAWF_018122 [Thalassiosira exigua]